MSYHNSAKAEGVKPLSLLKVTKHWPKLNYIYNDNNITTLLKLNHCIVAMANYQNSLSTLAPASIDKSASSPAGIMSPGLGPAELLRNCLLDWAPSGANKKRPPGLGPGSFLKKLQWGAVFLCQIEYGADGRLWWDSRILQACHHCRTLCGNYVHWGESNASTSAIYQNWIPPS